MTAPSTGAQCATDFTLEPLPFTLFGLVQDGHDRNVPKCEPTVLEVLDGPNAGRSNEIARLPPEGQISGSFEFPNLQPGTFTLRASAPGYYIVEKTARLRGLQGFNRLEFVLGRGPRPTDLSPVDCSLPPIR